MGLTSVEETIKAQLKTRKNAHIMLVEGISKLTTHKVKTFQSSVFHISGHKWKLIVHPAGKDGRSNYLSLHLRIKDKKSLGSTGEVKCTLKLIAVAQTGSNICDSVEWTMVSYSGKQAIHGKDNFMTHKMLKERYLANEKVAFGAEITNVRSNCHVTAIPRTIGTAERLKLVEVSRNNSKFTWKITQFSSFNGERHFSYEFTVGPRRWKLRINPKGTLVGTGNSLTLSLHATDFINTGPKAKTLVVYKLRVLDQLHRNHKELGRSCLFHYDLDHGNSYWGWCNFLPLEELYNPSMGYLVNDQIYFSVEFSLVSTTEYL